MIAKDWVTEAAKEIDDMGSSDESYLWVRDVIIKHCPFKVDVAYMPAYMPVPRCESCVNYHHAEHHGPDDGYCDTITAHVTKDFGCVKWEAK